MPRLEIVAIPVGDKQILYRPLRRLAFVGNAAMARLVLGQLAAVPSSEAHTCPSLPAPLGDFLARIGFLEPDPLPPSSFDGFRPTTAVLLLTSRCTLRCVYCYANAGEEEIEDLAVEPAQAVIDYVHQVTVGLGRPQFEVTFHGGGEPVAAWHTLRAATAYARAKDLPCRVSLVSNGVWTERQRNWILDNVNNLTISLDGSPETQDRQRPRASGRGSFRAVLRTVEALDRRNFSYGIRLTALAPWGEQLARDVEFICRHTGCQTMQVEPAFNKARGEYRPPSPQAGQAFASGFLAALEIARQSGRHLTYSGARPWVLTTTFCSAPYTALIVTPSGRLVTCYEIASPQHPLAETCTIGLVEAGQVILDKARHTALLDRLAARRAACRDCFCYWHCAGDCHAKALSSDISADQRTSIRCQMNRHITAQMLLSYISRSEDGVWCGDRMEVRRVGGVEAP